MILAVKALFFDVFGTLVDWRSSIAREAAAILQPRGYACDWHAFADAWRGEYQGAMEEVRAGRLAFCKLDVLHRRNLERVLPRFRVSSLNESERFQLTMAWHRLDAWPDVVSGLARLRRRYLLAPVSNGNISLMVDLARRNDFPLGRYSGGRDCAGLQAEAARLSRRRRSARFRSPGLHDGGRAQLGPCRCRSAWAALRPCGPAR
jgi:2-haloacid dehalogenase